MKVNVNTVAEIKATTKLSSRNLALMAKAAAGRKAVIEVDAAASIETLINAVKVSTGIDPTIQFADIYVKLSDKVLDKSKNLTDNHVVDGAAVSVVFKRIV